MFAAQVPTQRTVGIWFESHGFVLQEWSKVRTDSVTFRGATAAANAEGAA